MCALLCALQVTREEIHLRLNNEADSYRHISGLLELFDKIDGDHDNKLSPLEWRVGVLEHTRTQEDLEYIDFIDGILSDLEAIKNRKDMSMRRLRAEEVFASLDKDGDKFVTRDEITVLRDTEVYEFVLELFEAADNEGSGLTGSTSGDDKLTHDEWMRGIIFHTHFKSDAEFTVLMDQIVGLLQ